MNVVVGGATTIKKKTVVKKLPSPVAAAAVVATKAAAAAAQKPRSRWQNSRWCDNEIDIYSQEKWDQFEENSDVITLIYVPQNFESGVYRKMCVLRSDLLNFLQHQNEPESKDSKSPPLPKMMQWYPGNDDLKLSDAPIRNGGTRYYSLPPLNEKIVASDAALFELETQHLYFLVPAGYERMGTGFGVSQVHNESLMVYTIISSPSSHHLWNIDGNSIVPVQSDEITKIFKQANHASQIRTIYGEHRYEAQAMKKAQEKRPVSESVPALLVHKSISCKFKLYVVKRIMSEIFDFLVDTQDTLDIEENERKNLMQHVGMLGKAMVEWKQEFDFLAERILLEQKNTLFLYLLNNLEDNNVDVSSRDFQTKLWEQGYVDLKDIQLLEEPKDDFELFFKMPPFSSFKSNYQVQIFDTQANKNYSFFA